MGATGFITMRAFAPCCFLFAVAGCHFHTAASKPNNSKGQALAASSSQKYKTKMCVCGLSCCPSGHDNIDRRRKAGRRSQSLLIWACFFVCFRFQIPPRDRRGVCALFCLVLFLFVLLLTISCFLFVCSLPPGPSNLHRHSPALSSGEWPCGSLPTALWSCC